MSSRHTIAVTVRFQHLPRNLSRLCKTPTDTFYLTTTSTSRDVSTSRRYHRWVCWTRNRSSSVPPTSIVKSVLSSVTRSISWYSTVVSPSGWPFDLWRHVPTYPSGSLRSFVFTRMGNGDWRLSSLSGDPIGYWIVFRCCKRHRGWGAGLVVTTSVTDDNDGPHFPHFTIGSTTGRTVSGF